MCLRTLAAVSPLALLPLFSALLAFAGTPPAPDGPERRPPPPAELGFAGPAERCDAGAPAPGGPAGGPPPPGLEWIGQLHGLDAAPAWPPPRRPVAGDECDGAAAAAAAWGPGRRSAG